MKFLFDWIDDRTGYRHLLQEALYEPVPGGARWRYVWGSTLVFCFFVQIVTGIFLWSAYSPSAQTAWESVYYIQHEMYLGSVLRGVHHFAAQAMIVLMAIHLMQVIIDGAYRAPREFNFWLGLVLMGIVLVLSLTGYLLPWDQKGYYATQVSTRIVGAFPFVGASIQELAQGGTQYGHHTLTRFFAMHAGVLPGLMIVFLMLHIYLFRRHGITVRYPDHAPTCAFWPDQVLRDAVACLGVLAVILLLAVFKQAELSGPANPSEAYSAARPEWYFLSIFRFLRFEWVDEHLGLVGGAIYVPGAAMLILCLMPLVARIKGGHAFNVTFTWIMTAVIALLTLLSVYEDANDTDHQAAVAEAERDAHRVVELASGPGKIPIEGAGALLHDDPLTQGPRLFAKYCASCHRYDGHDGRGRMLVQQDSETGEATAEVPSAPDLGDFAGRTWWKSVLTDYRHLIAPIEQTDYDLETSAGEGMLFWFDENQEVMNDPANAADVSAMIEFLTAQNGHQGVEIDADLAARGEELISSGELTAGSISVCEDCHAGVGGEFEAGSDNGGIPELNGYGSAAWLRALIEDPGTDQFFGDKNVMPGFADKMTSAEIDLLVRWMVGDYAATTLERYESKVEALQTMLGQSEPAGESTD